MKLLCRRQTIENNQMNFQDKNEFLSKSDKFLFLQSLPNLLKEKSETYSIFYSTFTFKIPSRQISDKSDEVYNDFFRSFRIKLDKSLLSSTRQFNNRPILLLFPEKSKARTPNHFHGFSFIHKSTMQKFHKNCVAKISKEKISKLNDAERDNYILHSYMFDSLIKTAPKSFKNRVNCICEHAQNSLSLSEVPLVLDNHKMYLVHELKDFERAAHYSAKNFVTSASDYILECKDKPKERFKKV